MLSKNETIKVKRYLNNKVSCTEEERKYLQEVDDIVKLCIFDIQFARLVDVKRSIYNLAIKTKRLVEALFVIDDGLSPRLLEYLERYASLMQIYCKASVIDDTPYLSLLYLISKFDLKNNQSEAD